MDKLRQENAMVRQMVDKSKDKEMDLVIISCFISLRKSIQEIVHKYCGMEPVMKPEWACPIEGSIFKDQAAFFEGAAFQPDIPGWLRRFYVRGIFFQFLHQLVFSMPCFGLDEGMERYLGEFETALIAKKG